MCSRLKITLKERPCTVILPLLPGNLLEVEIKKHVHVRSNTNIFFRPCHEKDFGIR